MSKQAKQCKKVCSKVKNPCKICLRTVTSKNGLQCCGICQSWMHYKCANYTPGKLKDIKKGIIKVICPCPDCQTTRPKDYRTDKQKPCANIQCPANQPPKCKNKGCPIYEFEPAPGSDQYCTDLGKWPGGKCGKTCKKFPSSAVYKSRPKPPPPAVMPGQPLRTLPENDRCDKSSSAKDQIPASVPIPPNTKCEPQPTCLSRDCRLGSNVGDTNMSTQSSCNSNQFKVLEQMCSTVGLLSKQLNDFLCKMKGRQKSSPSPGTRPTCPKPCLCPKSPR